MAEHAKWQWQELGTAWRGVGVYHVTLTVPSREPLFGTLVVPENDPSNAKIERTALGNAVVDELYVMCKHYPEIRILQFCLMPDHLHAVVHVTRVMDTGIRSVIRGYWQGVKKLGRAYTLSVAAELNSKSSVLNTENLLMPFLMRVLPVVCLYSALGPTTKGNVTSVVPNAWLSTQWLKKSASALMAQG